MKALKILIWSAVLVGLVSCEVERPQIHQGRMVTVPFSHDKVPMIDPEPFGHDKCIYTPISYLAPFSDTYDSQLRLLVLNVMDYEVGITNPTTINIAGADSLISDGEYLTIYQDGSALISAYNTPEGSSSDWTDETLTILLYEDETISEPLPRYPEAAVPFAQKRIKGFYFLCTNILID